MVAGSEELQKLAALKAEVTCKHGVPTRQFCGRCAGAGETMAERMARLGRVDTTVRLQLPPTAGHAPRVERGGGRWTVCCSCGVRVARSSDRHDVEVAWNVHANGS